MNTIWILVLLLAQPSGTVDSSEVGVFADMYSCFDMRENMVEDIGRPIVNYQLICVQSNNAKIL